MVPNHYYPVLRSAQLKSNPVPLKRFGARWVAWRDAEGGAHIMPAACPHRGADLSQGSVQNGLLTCPWHGFRFDGSGSCRLAPCEGADGRLPANLRSNPAPLQEQHGLLWMWHGAEPPGAAVPFFPEAEAPEDLASSSEASYELPHHYSRMVETNLDIYHTPFVHRSVVPGVGPEVHDFECSSEGSSIRSRGELRHPGRDSGMPFAADFLAPCLVRVSLTPKLHILTAATPVDENTSWLWFRYYQGYTRSRTLGRAITWLSVQSELRVVQKQDWRIFARMTPGPLEDAPHNLVRSDLAIARYRQWRKQALHG